MPVKEESPPAHMLAGKRTGELVMRNGEPTGIPVQGDISGDISRGVSSSPGLDKCRTSDRMQQRLRALEAANEVRMDRSKVRRGLERGERDFDEFLDDTPACCVEVPVFKVLQWLPYVARTYAKKIIAEVDGLSQDTRMAELSQAQKYGLSAQVAAKMYRRGPREGHFTNAQIREKLWQV